MTQALRGRGIRFDACLVELPFDPWKLLLVTGFAVSWLIPNHYMPWPAFESDLAMALALTALAVLIFVRSRGAWSVDALITGCLAIALVPMLQWQFGLLHFRGDAWMSGAYLFGFALAMMVGRKARTMPNFVLDVVLGAALSASLLSVGVQLYQWLGLHRLDELAGLGVWLMHTSGARPAANLGQPNQLATLLLWGLIGTWWAFSRRWIGAGVAVTAAAYLLFGVAMTQSRTAWLGMIVLGGGLLGYRRVLDGRSVGVVICLLGLYCGLLITCWDAIVKGLLLADSVSLAERLQPGHRIANWLVCFEAVKQRPWFGFGWGQISVAQQSALLNGPASGEYLADAHNVVLDLILWNGVPLGLLICAGLAIWLWKTMKTIATPADALGLMALLVFLVHAMFEYPHAYAYLLLPAGLLIGALSAHRFASVIRLPRWAIGIALLAGMMLVAGIFRDYRHATESMLRQRFEAARIGTWQPEDVDLPLLTQLSSYLRTARVDVGKPVPDETLDLMRKTSERFPSDSTRFRYAMASANNGRPEAAREVLAKLCWVRAADDCKAIRAAWTELAETRHSAMRGLLPP